MTESNKFIDEFVDVFEPYVVCVLNLISFRLIGEEKEDVDKLNEVYTMVTDCILKIVNDHSGVLLGAFDDNAIFYFPNTNPILKDSEALIRALDCCLSLLPSEQYTKRVEGLADLSFKISADYQNLVLDKKRKLISYGYFIHLINLYRELIEKTPQNCVVVGEALYSRFFKFQTQWCYQFRHIAKTGYPIYLLPKEGEKCP